MCLVHHVPASLAHSRQPPSGSAALLLNVPLQLSTGRYRRLKRGCLSQSLMGGFIQILSRNPYLNKQAGVVSHCLEQLLQLSDFLGFEVGEKLPNCWMKNTTVRVLVQTLKNPPTPVGVPSQFYFRAKPLAKSKSNIQKSKSKILPKVRILDSGWADLGFGSTTRQFGDGGSEVRSHCGFLGLAATGAGRCLNEPGKGGGKNVSTNGSFKILCVQNWEPKMALI